MAETYKSEMKRIVYVTPTQFIKMLNKFSGLLTKKHDEITYQRQRYMNGVDKIKETSILVEQISQELADKYPVLEEKRRETEETMIQIQAEKKEAVKQREIVQEKEKHVVAQKTIAEEIKV